MGFGISFWRFRISPPSITRLVSSIFNDPSRNPHGNRVIGDIGIHHCACADDAIPTNGHAVLDADACPHPDVIADGDANGVSALLQRGFIDVIEIMRAPDKIGIGSDEGVLAELDLVGRKNLAVEAEVGVFAQNDVPVFAIKNCIAANERATADFDALVILTFGIQHHIIVDHHVIADLDFVGMPQHHVLPKRHVAADLAQ